jgi:hypothetical protein
MIRFCRLLTGLPLGFLLGLGCAFSESTKATNNAVAEGEPCQAAFVQKINSQQTVNGCVIEGAWLTQILEQQKPPDKIYLQNVTIKDNFALGSAKDHDPKAFKTNLSCDKCTFAGDVSLENSTWDRSVSFSDCHFNEGIKVHRSSLVELTITGYCRRLQIQNCTFAKAEFGLKSLNYLEVSIARFTGNVSFQNIECEQSGECKFQQITFDKTATFSGATLPRETWLLRTLFSGESDFSGVWAGNIHSSRCLFAGDAKFDEINAPRRKPSDTSSAEINDTPFRHVVGEYELPSLSCRLLFEKTRFKGRTSFSRTTCDYLRLGAADRSGYIPFEGPAHFEELTCKNLLMDGAEFSGQVSFAGSKITNSAVFYRVSFQKSVNLNGAHLPHSSKTFTKWNPETDSVPSPGISLEAVRFDDALEAHWEDFVQRRRFLLDDKLRTNYCGSESWFSLSAALKRAGNLKGENEATFNGRLAARSDDPREIGWLNWLSWVFWGYGYRPTRVLLWFFALTLICASFYWSETSKLARGRSAFGGLLARLGFSLAFSLRTAWSFRYGYKNANTRLFKLLTSVQSILSKLLLILLLQAVGNTSPFLNSIFGKVIKL